MDPEEAKDEGEACVLLGNRSRLVRFEGGSWAV